MSGLDVATGKDYVMPRKWGKKWSKDECEYTTSGPATVREVTEKLPSMPEVSCSIWSVGNRCTPKQIAALASGEAVVKDYVVVSPGPEDE
jgi:hypothetical protein